MNYSVLVTGMVIGFSIVYYYIWGKSSTKDRLLSTRSVILRGKGPSGET